MGMFYFNYVSVFLLYWYKWMCEKVSVAYVCNIVILINL
jgi:hypothetical protein